MIKAAKWVKSPIDTQDVCPVFVKEFEAEGKIKKATLYASAMGVYKCELNGKKIGSAVLMPGWTSYKNRVQYQEYDITEYLSKNNKFEMTVGQGWAIGYIGYSGKNHYFGDMVSAIFSIDILFEDGTSLSINSDKNADVYTSQTVYTGIYHGETIDRTAECKLLGKACETEVEPKLEEQQGEMITEHERIKPVKYFVTPKGERIIDFGQNMTGYLEVHAKGKKEDVIKIRHAEILDKDGNFYTENLRNAKQTDTFILGKEEEIFKPEFTFHGFRYICLDEYISDDVDINDFTAIVVHSDIKRTGSFVCGNDKINQLYHNVIWGQKSNYLDVPTDCPQRDERLGWTGDAQVFVRTAAINFDVEKFFEKWLRDVSLEQLPDGGVQGIVPGFPNEEYHPGVSAGWADASVICPWHIYLAYGNRDILINQFDSMKKWIEYMHSAGSEEFLWVGGDHYGDWLAMDAGEDASEYEKTHGMTNTDFIASCYFAYSTSLFVKAGEVLGMDMEEYKTLYKNIVNKIREVYIKDGIPEYKTQTACAISLFFDITDNPEKTAALLNELVRNNGTRLTTGFLGTPYLLHALSDNGYSDTAYDLLFQEAFPSWLFSVNRGATTMWEHWDGIKEDGTFWSAGMNSYNHYAYGAVFDWIFANAAGIKTDENKVAYKKITFKPIPDKRLGFVKSGIETRNGYVSSSWAIKDDGVHYEFTVPCGSEAEIILPSGKTYNVDGGTYMFIE